MRRLFGGLGARRASGEKPKKPIRANLGDESSFYYDEKLKSWVDRNDKSGAAGGGAAATAKTATTLASLADLTSNWYAVEFSRFHLLHAVFTLLISCWRQVSGALPLSTLTTTQSAA